MSAVRMFSETRNCIGCRFWSALRWRQVGLGNMLASCLHPENPSAGAETPARATCNLWKSGHHGVIDDPEKDVRALYEAEELLHD